ncbi:type II toxin-antitoxin system RelE/ParE family toxin [Xanthomonas fragariae]|uniref:type II toxin-antitoxin system RelE/ParE family toxin n=1 Tax=Xanthomonas fragariae TaxID=48664 RepID=UPI0022AA3EFA|nr:type II toxin-antitoxin system RelE/ParE family toxin [Xanthomonas fragariae]WAT16064.1 type II toxin-antitoxin system RelE/ParE family toxin [Xanthomonas fragariae]
MPEKPLIWVGSSRRDLAELPEDVKDTFGFALSEAQNGRTHVRAKPMAKGSLKGKGIYEVVDDYDGDTFRAVYTVEIEDAIYALHCFQKKSKNGRETPKSDIDLIESRYQAALLDAKKVKI